MPSKLVVTLQDHDEEMSSVSFEGETIDGTTYTVATAEAEMNALINALMDLTLCSHYKNQRVYSFGTFTLTPPANKFAQRETKWILRYRDNVNNVIHTKTLPGADLDLLDAQARGFLDQTDPKYTTFKAAFEQYHRAPVTGNTVTLLSAQHVGRNI